MFFKNMSERAAKILKDDMEALGPVRLRDVDEAQAGLSHLPKSWPRRAKSRSLKAKTRRWSTRWTAPQKTLRKLVCRGL